jgi:isopenicillin N synthase-like dioxygenase
VEGACHDTGFMYISGHGISPDVITRIRNAVVEYFNRPLHDKHADRISRDNYRG